MNVQHIRFLWALLILGTACGKQTAVSGPLAGERLTAVASHEFFWFAWVQFEPETAVYRAE